MQALHMFGIAALLGAVQDPGGDVHCDGHHAGPAVPPGSEGSVDASAAPDPGASFSVSLLPLVPGESFPGGRGRAFGALSADLEGDGDLDLIVNRHHIAPLELWRNEGGAYRLLNPPGADVSGLFENPGVPFLYERRNPHLARIEAEGGPGLYVWHEPDRKGPWHFYLWNRPGLGPATIEFEANWDIEAVTGLAVAEYALIDSCRVVVTPDPAQLERSFAIDVLGTANQGIVELREPNLKIFVGREMSLAARRRVELWKPDPHGMAWADVRGTPGPELVIVRGARQGNLLPPLDPKFDSFYEYAPSAEGLYAMKPTDFLPRNYTRSRQTEWVDVDGDGILELHVGNRESANQLLVLEDGGSRYRDAAAEWGLDLFEGESFAWVDLDGDGRQDLVFVDEGGLSGLRNTGGGPFAPIDMDALGLALSGGLTGDLFRLIRLHVADFDNDGRLDLLASGVGSQLSLRLFLRRGGIFEDATATVGLAEVRHAGLVLPIDIDNDSFLDAVVLEATLRLLRNEAGERFAPGYFHSFAEGAADAATVTDADGDGQQDVVVVRQVPPDTRRHLALNTSRTRNSFLRVELAASVGEPVGALVSAHYADGTVRTQRYGSADNPPFCQTLVPLHFGVPAQAPLEGLSVLWPGESHPVEYPRATRHVGGTLRLRR